jgi:hypothetical protein
MFKSCIELSNLNINNEIKVKEKSDVGSKIFRIKRRRFSSLYKEVARCVLLCKYEMFQH